MDYRTRILQLSIAVTVLTMAFAVIVLAVGWPRLRVEAANNACARRVAPDNSFVVAWQLAPQPGWNCIGRDAGGRVSTVALLSWMT